MSLQVLYLQAGPLGPSSMHASVGMCFGLNLMWKLRGNSINENTVRNQWVVLEYRKEYTLPKKHRKV